MTTENGYMSRDDFLASCTAEVTEEARLPNGRKILLKSIPESQRVRDIDLWQMRNGKPDKVRAAMLRARIVQLCACNPDGSRMFTDADLTVLHEQAHSAWLTPIVLRSMRLLGVTEDDVEDEAKN